MMDVIFANIVLLRTVSTESREHIFSSFTQHATVGLSVSKLVTGKQTERINRA